MTSLQTEADDTMHLLRDREFELAQLLRRDADGKRERYLDEQVREMTAAVDGVRRLNAEVAY